MPSRNDVRRFCALDSFRAAAQTDFKQPPMDYFRETLEGLKQTAEGLIVANQGIKRAVEAALAARSEHDDLRDTVHRLEALVMQQGLEIRAMRDELRNRKNGDS